MMIIATGSKDEGTDKAIEWLKERGAKVEDCMEVSIIRLPETATIEHVERNSYAVDLDDDEPGYCVLVTLSVDVRNTELVLALKGFEEEVIDDTPQPNNNLRGNPYR